MTSAKKKFLITLFVCACAVLVSLFLYIIYEEHRVRYVFPPLIMVNNVMYKGSGPRLEALPTNSIYLGKVTSTVASNQAPIHHLEMNRDLYLGRFVYQSENKIITGNVGEWWVYYELE